VLAAVWARIEGGRAVVGVVAGSRETNHPEDGEGSKHVNSEGGPEPIQLIDPMQGVGVQKGVCGVNSVSGKCVVWQVCCLPFPTGPYLPCVMAADDLCSRLGMKPSTLHAFVLYLQWQFNMLNVMENSSSLFL